MELFFCHFFLIKYLSLETTTFVFNHDRFLTKYLDTILPFLPRLPRNHILSIEWCQAIVLIKLYRTENYILKTGDYAWPTYN